MSTLKRYRFHWLGNVPHQDGEGRSAADALTRLGYGRGAVAALDFYEELTAGTEGES